MRDEPDGIHRYVYIGTGNLNASTAAGYTDVGILTADPGLGEELNAVFGLLTGYSASAKFGRLLVSPSKAEESGFCQGFSLVRREAKASFKYLQPIGPYGPMPYQVWRSERWRERRAGDLDSWPHMRPFLFTERSEAISLRRE